MLTARREFLKITGLLGASLALPAGWFEQVCSAAGVRNGKGRLPVLWFQGQACSGCSVSLLNSEYPGPDEILIEVISLNFHACLMAAAGDTALEVMEQMITQQKDKYLLVIEGSIPLAENGEYCAVGEKDNKPVTAAEWIRRISADAMAVAAVGSCASWGGIPASGANPTGAVPASELIKNKPLINIPGCPAHPAWIVGTLAHVLNSGIPPLDADHRPLMFFGPDKKVHDNCERRMHCDKKIFATDFSEDGCLYELGCRGPIAHCDSNIRGWNGGANWCVRSGGPCIGCTESSFPGNEFSSLYYYKNS